jgi:putative transcription factor
MSGPITQDLKEVVIRRKQTKEEAIRKGLGTIEKKHEAGTNHQTSSVADARKLDNEEITIPYSTVELGKKIQTARVAKNMKQVDLDKVCNFPRNTIRDYENSTCVTKQDQITKMERALGVKLPRPKPTKIEKE